MKKATREKLKYTNARKFILFISERRNFIP